MTKEELKDILEKHKKWLNDEKGGERADLRNADLSDADLRNADLIGADLSYANLIGADLSNADLSYANLIGADLSNADLSNADLNNTNLRKADLSYANLRWANLGKVIGLDVIIVQINTSAYNRQIKYIPKLNEVFAGCFCGTLDELKKQVKITHKDNDVIKNRYLKAIKFIEEIVKDYEKEKSCQN